ncbi:Asp-tRNA(Asn)/Glu-tRNA(Gln) amidotransferase subunit GatC [Candidatus Wolfebacteria bacterium]|nr:Asp-tRNA(Asn)/Glu-tRNA(Gln) amidotransferase subunit GatC [Candidatus Wolfebacteria bacterium]
MDKKDIENLAQLARIGLSEEEKENLLKDTEDILVFVGKVQKVEVDMRAEERIGIPHNVIREDVTPHEAGIYTEALLAAAPAREGNYVKVKNIL